MAVIVITRTGADVTPYLGDLARLRIAVFREYPYLYEGSIDYERDYLTNYASSAESVFVLALDQDRVVGASTGLPLSDESAAFRQPFVEHGFPIEQVFYFGESVLEPAYRGQRLGHRFFDAREAHARASGRFRWTAFCAVERAEDDPRRPPDYRSHDVFWTKRGYQRQDAMFCNLRWTEAGASAPSAQRLRFWLHAWELGE